MEDEALTVIVAIEDSAENIEAILERLDPAKYPSVHFLFGFAGSEIDLPTEAMELSNVGVLKVPGGCRIPHIWAEGIRRSRTGHVGLLTGQFLPGEKWVARALVLPWNDRRAGFGGVISNAPGAGAMDWAIFILRYSRFAPPQRARAVQEVAADNAVYRRDLILEEESLLDNGFWEPAFHERFRQRGFDLAIDPELIVEQQNRYSARSFASQRYRHALEFGLERAETKSKAWIHAMILLSPVLPGVFLAKVLSYALRSQYCRPHVFSALPWIAYFLVCWGMGESRGYLKALGQGR